MLYGVITVVGRSTSALGEALVQHIPDDTQPRRGEDQQLHPRGQAALLDGMDNQDKGGKQVP